MSNLHLMFQLAVLVLGISIVCGKEIPECLNYVSFHSSVIGKLKDRIKCGDMKTDNINTTFVNVAYTTGSPGKVYYAGAYEYLGTADGSAIYSHAQHYHRENGLGNRAIILIDWQGSNAWIGTTQLGMWKDTSTWLRGYCEDKNIECCKTTSWEVRNKHGEDGWLFVAVSYASYVYAGETKCVGNIIGYGSVYGSLAEAQMACENDKSCTCIQDSKCEGESFTLYAGHQLFRDATCSWRKAIECTSEGDCPSNQPYCPNKICSGCQDSDSLTGFKFSHDGTWEVDGKPISTDMGTMLKVECAKLCLEGCFGIHIQGGNIDHGSCHHYGVKEDLIAANQTIVTGVKAYTKCSAIN